MTGLKIILKVAYMDNLSKFDIALKCILKEKVHK